jgi:hypothetical protein
MPHHSGSQHESPAQGGQPKPCKTAAVPCCIAMTSCGTTIALRPKSADVFQVLAQSVPGSDLSQPLSRVAAPEPPPPKA